MAKLPGGPFNAADVDPTQTFDPIPAGKYPMSFTESEMKPTKNGDGQYLQLVAEVLDGEYRGRKVWERLNLVNRNPTAVEIAQRTLSAICRAVGVMNPTDSAQLHGRPFLGRVKFVPAQGSYEAKNEMGGYEPLTGTPPSASAPAAAQYAAATGRGAPAPAKAAPARAAPAAAGNGSPPWLKQK